MAWSPTIGFSKSGPKPGITHAQNRLKEKFEGKLQTIIIATAYQQVSWQIPDKPQPIARFFEQPDILPPEAAAAVGGFVGLARYA